MPSSRKKAQTVEPALGVSAEEYNAFVEGIELRSIRLAKCTVDASDRFDDSSLTPEVEEGSASYTVVPEGFIVLQELKFRGRPESSSIAPVSISATFELVFDSDVAISDSLFAVFRRFNLPVNIWPFFREFVHTVLARVNWPVFLLPALKIGNRGARPPTRRRTTGKPETSSAP